MRAAALTRLILLPAVLWAVSPSTSKADPTAEQQYWLELINRARRDPAGELGRLVNYNSPTTFGSPSSNDPFIAQALTFYGTSAFLLASQWATLTAAPALAWNDTLGSSAVTYSQAMISADVQSHLIGGQTVEDRITGAGYTSNYLDLGENLFGSASSVYSGHGGFLIDWGDDDNNSGNGYGTGLQSPAGHREISFESAFKEIGIGIRSSGIPLTNVNVIGPLVVTQHLANTYRLDGINYVADAILTGVVFDDSVLNDNFYTPGEGLSGTTIEVYDSFTNDLLFSGLTNTAGGYNIDLTGVQEGDQLRVSAVGSGLADQILTITGYTTDPSVYGAPVTFVDNPYAGFQVAPVPEPTGLLLTLLGAVSLQGVRRRRLSVG